MNARRAGLPPPPKPERSHPWALFLDVDGTLLDFVDDPAAVRVPSTLAHSLDALHARLRGALALISGRTIADLDRLFQRPSWAAAGLHGFERRNSHGTIERLQVHPAQVDELRRNAAALARQLPGIRVEDKGVAVALHYREAPQQGDALKLAAAALADELPDFELQPGNHVVEFKPRGMDKGLAVAGLLDTPPFKGRLPVYVGDDLTDEHGFQAANAHGGFSVRVGDREPSQATSTLADVASVHAWLKELAA
ncbi:trehalose-phosphatase [Pinirhizobacter sp.]|uniref:trehalose-phosphatase n=1 Tax=Pinirhizobacter sp. TaxID=2950432 RepID=UPI002F3F7200